ncbi:hypothetical protein AB8Q84_29830, partial [Klebsiella quasivariicola]|uniref:hypothetical protein n=1 Tax=Klebsiella quasivariicola TaxID=2026240 RepID=UPI0038D18108
CFGPGKTVFYYFRADCAPDISSALCLSWRRRFPGGGALRLVRATKSQSAVAPVSGSATGGFEIANTGSFSQHGE